MTILTGLSGNEIFCLAQKNYTPGNIVVGNSVHSLGMLRSISSGFRTFVGGEVTEITQLIEDGRETAYERMMTEALARKGAAGVTGVTSELIYHGGNIEFLSIGSVIYKDKNPESVFSTADNGQELYAQLDAGYTPICFSFGNVAYAMGLTRGIMGGIKQLARGEIREYSEILNHTRHLALERITAHAQQHNANAVLGIRTTILPFGGANEMIMLGTASHNPHLNFPKVASSSMSNIELWSLAKMGYAPMQLLLGTSVYSLGLVGGITSTLKSFVRGEITELTHLLYAARENALNIIYKEAKELGADDVLGVKTYVYQLGSGLVEFLVLGTAVKKIPQITTASQQLLPQAIVTEHTTFYSSNAGAINIAANTGEKSAQNLNIPGSRILSFIFTMSLVAVYMLYLFYFGK